MTTIYLLLYDDPTEGRITIGAYDSAEAAQVDGAHILEERGDIEIHVHDLRSAPLYTPATVAGTVPVVHHL